MIGTEKKVVYEAFGLKMISDIPFPELAQISAGAASPDIEIAINYTLKLSFNSEVKPYEFAVHGRTVKYYVPDTAFFSIEDGKTINVAPMNDGNEDLIRLYLLGTCIGILLMQRKVCPLHGSAVAVDGKAYAFIGESGAGKSTLASALISRGCLLLSDDVVAVSLTERDHTPLVTPSFPQQKLWQQSLDEFGIDMTQYRSIYGRETKYCVPVIEDYFDKPLPLGGIFELVKATEPEHITLHSIHRLDRIKTLFQHTYRQFLLLQMGLMPWHFQFSAAIANQINFFQLRRPADGFSALQLASLILDTIALEDKR